MKRGIAITAITALLLISAAAQQKGADIYKAKCQTCHASDGSGNTAIGRQLHIGDLRSLDVTKKSDAELIKATSSGVKRGAIQATILQAM